MNLGKIITQRCVGEPCGPDPRCADPVFALMHPDLCPPLPYLLIRPSFALTCQLGSIQFAASFFNEQGVETDVTDQTLFSSSDLDVVLIGAVSGNATGLTAGEVTITGTYIREGDEDETFTGTAELTVLGDDCCDDQNVAMMLLVDRTKSMSQPFAGYPSKLGFAKAAASRFISEVNEQKDLVGLISFTALGPSVLASPTTDKAAVGALVPGITQTQQLTTFYDALSEAITQLNAITTAELRVIVLISDGEDKDDWYNTADNPIALLQDFKDAGGIVITMGVRAHDFGYSLLSHFSTGGFSLNAFGANAAAALDSLSGLKGYICAGNCTDPGDEFRASAHLNYCGFANWNVLDGHVDLMGNGFLDLLPGHGLFVDLAGSRSGFHGRLESKATFAIEEDKQYRVRVSLAGNQRVNATPNTVTISAFKRNTDTIATPAAAPIADAPTGTGIGVLQEYEYAYSYVNANGETPLSPVETGDNGGYATFAATIGTTAEPSATLVRFYKRLSGTDTWYKVAEANAAAPSFVDTFDSDDIAEGLANGAFDACTRPVTSNSTGTPVVIFEQDITIDDYVQPFATTNLVFDAPYDAEVWLAIQQTASPAGYDSVGLLLNYVLFENVTDDVELLEEDFDQENIVYVPPACGMGTHYVPTGYYFIPGDFTPLVPSMFANNVPEGYEASMGSIATTNEEDWWAAFDDDDVPFTTRVFLAMTPGSPSTMDPSTEYIQMHFVAGPKVVARYLIRSSQSPPTQLSPTAWELLGSNDGSNWDVLDARSGEVDWGDEESRTFTVTTPGSYSYYRIAFSEGGDAMSIATVGKVQFYESSGTYGVLFGYIYGYDCYGVGCLDEPPDVQAQDPSPLKDIEVGTPPKFFEGEAEIVRSCPAGFVYVPDTALSASLEAATCPDDFVATLDGLRWEMFAGTNVGQYGAQVLRDPDDVSRQLHGLPGTTYNVTLRFRGVVKRHSAEGADFTVIEPGLCLLIPAFLVNPPVTGNCYYLFIDTPGQGRRIYFLNSFPGSFGISGNNCFKIDYEITIEIAWNATVTLRARSQDLLMNRNFVQVPGFADLQPGVIPGIRNGGAGIAPDNCTFQGVPSASCVAFVGQFIEMTVVSVVAQP